LSMLKSGAISLTEQGNCTLARHSRCANRRGNPLSPHKHWWRAMCYRVWKSGSLPLWRCG